MSNKEVTTSGYRIHIETLLKTATHILASGNIQGGPIKCYHFSIIPKFLNVNLFKIFIQRFVIRNNKPTFNINEFVKSEL